MMMKALEAGGLPPVADGIREADIDNPNGYYEFERAKLIKDDAAWLADTAGKVVKMVSQLLFDLPTDRKYKVVFMRRELREVLASQQKMLDRRGEDQGPGDTDMKRMFVSHLAEMEGWLRKQNHIEVLYVSYNRMLKEPRKNAQRVADFVGGLDVDAMAAIVDPTLYRQRRK